MSLETTCPWATRIAKRSKTVMYHVSFSFSWLSYAQEITGSTTHPKLRILKRNMRTTILNTATHRILDNFIIDPMRAAWNSRM